LSIKLISLTSNFQKTAAGNQADLDGFGIFSSGLYVYRVIISDDMVDSIILSTLPAKCQKNFFTASHVPLL